jgi:hypothetical protein
VGAGCSAILGLQPPPPGDDGTDATTDATPEGGADVFRDTSAEGSAGPEASTCPPLNAGNETGTVYRAFGNYSTDDAGGFAWQIFDTSLAANGAGNYQGGAFDGRYVYLAPAGGGPVLRYDTKVGFSIRASWTPFDTTPLGGQSFSGAVYDGRYVYFVPYQVRSGSSGLVVRYDTAASFTAIASWSVFDTATLPVPAGATPAAAFHGGVFDGRYVYFVPSGSATAHAGRVARYDTVVPDSGAAVPDAGRDAAGAGEAGVATFGTIAQWATFDPTTQDPSAFGFFGGAFDGTRLYLVPYFNGGGGLQMGYDGIVSRYDTSGSLTAVSSWSSYDVTGVDPKAVGFEGAAFDGRYIYLAPHHATVAARFDTQAPVDSLNRALLWSTYDVSPFVADAGAGAGFWGTGFDGRFVYFVPGVAGDGRVVRFDTLSSAFDAPCAWSVFDVTRANAGASSASFFAGAIYDGRWLYLIPQGTWIARFDTKTPASMPPGYSGSFY